MHTSRFVRRTLLTSLAVLMLLVTITVEARRPNKEPSLAARVQRLEDIEEIHTLLFDYGRFMDARDFVAVSHLFAKDGEWSNRSFTVHGPVAIQAFMEKTFPADRTRDYHLISSLVIDVHLHKATVWSRWTIVGTGADKRPTITWAGHWDDTLIREGGRWKCQHRVSSVDLP